MPGVYSKDGDSQRNYRVIWETSPKTFRWHQHEVHDMLKDVVLDVVKPGHGEYVGFGEQGGTSFAKLPTFMNYFSMLHGGTGPPRKKEHQLTGL
jgi:hypothetical protein